jgi:hypothetical protein
MNLFNLKEVKSDGKDKQVNKCTVSGWKAPVVTQ